MHQTSNISHTLDNEIVDHSDVVRVEPVACRCCSNCIFILVLTPGFNGYGKGNWETRRETYVLEFGVPYIRDLTVLEPWRVTLLFSFLFLLRSWEWPWIVAWCCFPWNHLSIPNSFIFSANLNDFSFYFQTKLLRLQHPTSRYTLWKARTVSKNRRRVLPVEHWTPCTNNNSTSQNPIQEKYYRSENNVPWNL